MLKCFLSSVIVYCAGIHYLTLANECSSSNTLPEVLQTVSSACYGDRLSSLSCDSSLGTVIAIKDVKVGVKKIANGCPDYVQERDGILYRPNTSVKVDDTLCCFPDEINVCIFSYTTIPFTYRYRYPCTGVHNCTDPKHFEVSRAPRNNDCCTNDTMELTNFMFIEYYCIHQDKIIPMSSNGSTVEGNTLYIQNDDYPENISSSITKQNCSIQAKTCSGINLHTLDIRLTEEDGACKQSLTIQNSNTTTLYYMDCSSNTYFNITTNVFSENYLLLTFENQNNFNGGNIWLGFQAASTEQNITITCPAIPENVCNDPIISTTVTPKSPSTIANSQESIRNEGSSLPLITGIVIGVLALLAIAVIVCCCYFHKRKRKNQAVAPDKDLTNKEDVDDIQSPNLNSATLETGAAPANTKFRPSTSPASVGLVSPTPFIMRHTDPEYGQMNNDHGPLNTEIKDGKLPARLPPLDYSIGTAIVGGISVANDQNDDNVTSEKHQKHKKKKKKHRHKRENDVNTETVEKKETSTNMMDICDNDVQPLIYTDSMGMVFAGEIEQNDGQGKKKKKKKKHRNKIENDESIV